MQLRCAAELHDRCVVSTGNQVTRLSASTSTIYPKGFHMDSNLLSIAQQFTGLPMDSLIGGPLNAAANANAAMALTQTKFLLDTCFQKKSVPKSDAVGKPGDASYKPAADAHDEYTPIMINMSLTRAVITPGQKASADGKVPATDTKITPFVTTFNLPILTIVPLNSLAVQTVDITFEMEVKSSFSEEESQATTKERKGEASFEAKLGWGPLSVTIKGSASYDQKDSSTHNTHYEKSNSAKYTVNVHAAQLPLPKGVNTIIEAFAQSITPITAQAA